MISEVRARVWVRISDFSLSPSPMKWPGPKSSDLHAYMQSAETPQKVKTM
jgi:hypothetical protein